MATKKRYRKRRYRREQLMAAPVLSVSALEQPETDKLADEIRFGAKRVGICFVCGHRTEVSTPLYWVPDTGLARHTVCEPDLGYLVAWREWRSDEIDKIQAPMKEMLEAVKTTIDYLEHPDRAGQRRKLVARLLECDGIGVDPYLVAAAMQRRGHERPKLRVIEGGTHAPTRR